MTKRIVIGGVVIVLFAVSLAIPYWFGIKAEQGFDERVQAFADRSGLKITRKHFERGWFVSQAETSLGIPGAPIELTAQYRIYHGPLLVGRWFEGDFNLNPAQARIETHGALKLGALGANTTSLDYRTDTTIALGGGGHVHLQSPPIKHQGTDGNAVEWHGLQGDIQFDNDMHHLRTELRAPRFVFNGGEISDVRFNSDVQEGIAGHYLGKSTLDIASVSFGPFSAGKLRVSGDTAAHGESLTILIVYEVANVKAGDNDYGPGRLALEVRKLDAAVLARFQQELNELQRSDRPTEQIGLLQLGKLLQLVGELSKKAPELEITELKFRMGSEAITGRAKFVLDGSKSNIAQNPLLILTALTGEAELTLPPALLKPMLLPLVRADLENFRRRGLVKQAAADPTPEQLTTILDRALPLYLARHDFTRRLVPAGNSYRLSASLRRGQILVNGEPLNIAGASILPLPQN